MQNQRMHRWLFKNILGIPVKKLLGGPDFKVSEQRHAAEGKEFENNLAYMSKWRNRKGRCPDNKQPIIAPEFSYQAYPVCLLTEYFVWIWMGK